MLIRQLEYFITLAQAKHFARAAEICEVSQPALSDGLRKLENELGVPLVRRGRSYEGLTPEGSRLIGWATQVVTDARHLQAAADELLTGDIGPLRIGTVPSAAASVAPLVAQFTSVRPNVDTHIETDLPTDDIVRRLLTGGLDVGIGYPLNDPRLVEQPLYVERWVIAATEDLLHGAPEVMTWSDVAKLPLALLDPATQGRHLIDQAFSRADTTPALTLSVDSFATACAFAATGKWAAIVTDRWLMDSGMSTNLVLAELTTPVLNTTIVAAHVDRTPMSPLIRQWLFSLRTRPRRSLPATDDADDNRHDTRSKGSP